MGQYTNMGLIRSGVLKSRNDKLFKKKPEISPKFYANCTALSNNVARKRNYKANREHSVNCPTTSYYGWTG